MAAVGHSERVQAFKGGVIAGLLGGIVISVYMLIANFSQGRDIWVGMKMAGAPFLGLERAMVPGFEAGPVLLGLLCHFAVSVAWGALFGYLFYGFSRGATLALGLLWGVVVWFGMFYIVLPVVGLAEITKSVPVGAAILEHLVFGLAVAAGFLPFQRRVERPTAPRLAPTAS
jgi:hypothetical protein